MRELLKMFVGAKSQRLATMPLLGGRSCTILILVVISLAAYQMLNLSPLPNSLVFPLFRCISTLAPTPVSWLVGRSVSQSVGDTLRFTPHGCLWTVLGKFGPSKFGPSKFGPWQIGPGKFGPAN